MDHRNNRATWGRTLAGAILAAAMTPSAAPAQEEARVTAERTEGEPWERSAFFHDESGLEVFAFEEVTPVTVVVRLLNRAEWGNEDIDDAERQLATCEQGLAQGVTRTIRGRELTLAFDCARPG